jgi:hypothetical protein
VTCVADSPPAVPLQIPDIDAQDPWESRNAWKDVLAALAKGDIQNIVKKTKLEEAQRAMRKKEAAEGIKLEPKFFSSTEDDPVFRKLAAVTSWQLHAERTKVYSDSTGRKQRRPRSHIMVISHHSDE